MSLFERFLPLWVALCIVAGVALGDWVPDLFHAIGAIARQDQGDAALVAHEHAPSEQGQVYA